MAEVFLGQVMMTGFGFAPKGFALSNGQLLPVGQYQALFSLLGTRYGGNGQTNVPLPNLQGRSPMGAGASVDPAWQPPPFPIGTVSGVEHVTLVGPELAAHTHQVRATTAAGAGRSAVNAGFAASSLDSESVYAAPTAGLIPLAGNTVALAGGSLPHANMQPYAVINFAIALSGIFPSRS